MDKPVRETIRKAIVQELVDRIYKESKGYIALSPKTFDVNIDPNDPPLISLDISADFPERFENFGNDIFDSIIVPFFKGLYFPQAWHFQITTR